MSGLETKTRLNAQKDAVEGEGDEILARQLISLLLQ